MNLTPKTEELFLRGIRNPYFWGVTFLREIAVMTVEEAKLHWQANWNSINSKEKEYLANAILIATNSPRRENKILKQAEAPAFFWELLEIARPFISKVDPYIHERPELTERVGWINDQISIAFTSKNQLAQFQALVPRVEESIESFKEQDQRHELIDAQLMILEEIAGNLKKALRFEEALETYRRALHISKQYNKALKEDELLLKIANFYLDGSPDLSESLRLVIPLWLDRSERQASLELAGLSALLAQSYLKANDFFEANKFKDYTQNFLVEMGYSFLRPTSLPVNLENWVTTTLNSTDNHFQFNKSYLQVIQLYQKIVKIEADMLPLGDGRDLLYDLVDEFSQLSMRLNEIQFKKSQEEELLKQELFGSEINESVDIAEMEALNQMMLEYGQMIQNYRNELDQKGPSEQLLQKIEAQITPVKTNLGDLMAVALHWLAGDLLAEQKKHSKAETHYQRALEICLVESKIENSLYSLQRLIENGDNNDHEKLFAYCNQAIDLVESARAKISTPYQQSSFLRDHTVFYHFAIAISKKIKDYNQLLFYGELLKSRNLKNGNFKEEPHSDFVLKIRDLSEKIDQAVDEEQKKLSEIRQQLWDKWLLDQHSNTTSWKDWDDELIPKLQDRLSTKEIIINYLLLMEHHFLIMVITKDKVLVLSKVDEKGKLFRELTAMDFLKESGENYRMRASRGIGKATTGKSKIEAEELLHLLGKLVLPDEILALLEGKDQIYFCPHKQLHRLPFHALPFEEGFLIEKFAISYVPKIQLLLREIPAEKFSGNVLLVGASNYEERKIEKLSPIPFAEEELQTIGELYHKLGKPFHSIIGKQATEKKLLTYFDQIENKAQKPRILHFALHGEDAPENSPLDARLFLHEGSLDSFDISLWNLRADLVILSCCFGGSRPTKGRGLEELPTDDLFGLQAAFFTAGTERLLGALWPVDDFTGKVLMVDFHHQLQDYSPARAWQKTVIKYLRDSSPEKRHPVYWATFFLTEISIDQKNRSLVEI